MNPALDCHLLVTPQRGVSSRIAIMICGQPMLVMSFDHDCDVEDQVNQAVLGLHGEPLDRKLAASWLGEDANDRMIVDAVTGIILAESGYDIIGERRGHLARVRCLSHARLLAQSLQGEGQLRIVPAHQCNDIEIIDLHEGAEIVEV
jgi:hypothetical protein